MILTGSFRLPAAPEVAMPPAFRDGYDAMLAEWQRLTSALL